MLKGKGIIDKGTYENYLSQRICELTGIKPYYGVYVNFGDLDNNYRLVTNKRKFRLIADVRYYVDSDDDLRNLSPKFLPDFEKNNNFVKLLELLHREMNLDTLFLFIKKDGRSLKTALLECIFKLITYQLGYKIPLVKKIRRHIKNEQWEISSQ